MGAGASQSQFTGGLQPEVLDLARVSTNAALNPATDSAGALLAAMLFNPHDEIVTSPSVLGYEAGARYLAIMQAPGTVLQEPSIPLQD